MRILLGQLVLKIHYTPSYNMMTVTKIFLQSRIKKDSTIDRSNDDTEKYNNQFELFIHPIYTQRFIIFYQ